jgi:hypothetical protein
MTLLESLPTEIEEIEFEQFLEKIKREFPANHLPELFIHYQRVDDKILILGIGKSGECSQQARRAYEENPELRNRKSMTRILKAPKKRFLLR